jgi:hypothetical protein
LSKYIEYEDGAKVYYEDIRDRMITALSYVAPDGIELEEMINEMVRRAAHEEPIEVHQLQTFLERLASETANRILEEQE